MYCGPWKQDILYKKGHVVSAPYASEYYVCVTEHLSNNVSCPSREDMYWVYIDNQFLMDLINCTYCCYNEIRNNGSPQSDHARRHSCSSMEDTSLRDPRRTNIDQVEPKGNADGDEFKKRQMLKRKLRNTEKSIENYKRQKTDSDISNLREQLLLLNVDIPTKAFIMDKYENVRKASGSDASKGMTWLKTVASIPYGRHKPLKAKGGDSKENIQSFFKEVKEKLDASIYGLTEVKQEILEFIARKITNPKSKGHVLALCGDAGVGKTKIIKTLATALNLPFYQINCGGLNDVSVLTGHSETYVGSKPGKIVEILSTCQYMNPIIYLDELDKISDVKMTEINGVLTHMLDEEQNKNFQDNYLSNIPLNLSQVFFVIAFNDISKINEIVCDRLKIIYINKPTLQDKISICQDKIIPEIVQDMNFKDKCIQIDTEVISYIILKKCEQESGIRHLKKTMEKIINRVNYDILIDNIDLPKTTNNGIVYNITTSYVDKVINTTKQDLTYLSMYT